MEVLSACPLRVASMVGQPTGLAMVDIVSHRSLRDALQDFISRRQSGSRLRIKR
jgi:hypothetical protein